MMSSRVANAVPVSGHVPHQVTVCPGVGEHVPAVHDFPSCTSPPRFIVQSSRLAATLHWLPGPGAAQKGGLGPGDGFPPLFMMTACFFASTFPSVACTVRSARDLPCVPPASAHFPSAFSRPRRYVIPAFPMPAWHV